MKRAKKYEKEVVKVFKALRRRFNKAYKHAQGGFRTQSPILNPLAAFARATGLKKGSITKSEWEEIATISTNGLEEELSQALILTTNGEFAHTVKEVGSAVVQLHGRTVIDNVVNGDKPVQALEFLETYEFELSEATAIRTDARLKDIIRNGLSQGQSNQRIRDTITSHFDQLTEREAFMIARTETIRASAEGAKIGYLSTGIEYVDVLPAGDACPICVSIAGENPYRVDDAGAYAPFHPNCYLHHSIPITTDKGEKQIGSIAVGDNVLTHKGRFRPVTRVLNFKDRYKGDAVKLRFKGNVFGDSNTRNSVTVTPEHPFLTQRGWVSAFDIDVFDKLYVIANRCGYCSCKIPNWLKYCDQNCKFAHQPETKKKISESKQGEGNAMFGVGGGDHPRWNGGKVGYRGRDWKYVREKVLVRDKHTCQKCGVGQDSCKKKYKGQPLQVHHINPYRDCKCNEEDNCITYCPQCHILVERTQERDVLESGGYEFVDVPVLEVEHVKDFSGEKLYNFSVEEDESYIAKGIVNHNCRCAVSPVVNGKSYYDQDIYPEVYTTGGGNPTFTAQ